MKKILFVPVFLFLLSACGNNDQEAEIIPASEIQLWDAGQDSTGKLIMQQQLAPDVDSLSVEAILTYLNNNNPEIQLQAAGTGHDTLYLKIPDATHLTQQMGSSGPEIYFAEVVYNCTEIPGIRVVQFDFIAGDHAEPGAFKREDFPAKKR